MAPRLCIALAIFVHAVTALNCHLSVCLGSRSTCVPASPLLVECGVEINHTVTKHFRKDSFIPTGNMSCFSIVTEDPPSELKGCTPFGCQGFVGYAERSTCSMCNTDACNASSKMESSRLGMLLAASLYIIFLLLGCLPSL